MMNACPVTRRDYVRPALLAFGTAFMVLALFLWWAGAEKYPQAGDVIYQQDGSCIDASYASLGYIQVKQRATEKRVKARVSKGEYQLDYDLNNEGRYEVLPLQWGSGEYKVTLYIQVSGDRYLDNYTKRIQVALEDELSPFCYPNQYVWYTADSLTVAKAGELCQGLESDRDKFLACADFVQRFVVYDYFLAMSVKSGYLPDVDTTLTTKKGICFDYASLLAAMLRSQGIPCRLVIGYADTKYHAWNSIYLDGAWEDFDPTYASTGGKAEAYTAQRYY